jgi:hypothetical protein
MRGSTPRQVTMVRVISPEELIPAGHPIRRSKPLAAASRRDWSLRSGPCAPDQPPSIPPARLLKCRLLMARHPIRSERQVCGRLRCDLLFERCPNLNVEAAPISRPLHVAGTTCDANVDAGPTHALAPGSPPRSCARLPRLPPLMGSSDPRRRPVPEAF